MFLSAILPYYNGLLLMLMLLKNKVPPLLDKWGYCLNKRYKTFFKKHLTNVSICDKILWYCGATGYTVRLGQSEPCKFIRHYADMAELADAYGSGPYVRKDMQVQVLLSALKI